MTKSRYKEEHKPHTFQVCRGRWHSYFIDKDTREQLNQGDYYDIEKDEVLEIKVPEELENRPNTMLMVMRIR